MDWGGLFAALAAVVAAVISGGAILRGRHERIHGSIRKDLDLYSGLPEISASRARLLADIDERVDDLLSARRQERRNPSSIAAGITLLAAATGCVYLILTSSSSWWLMLWLAVVLFAGAGAQALQDGLPKRLRDERGRRLDAAANPSRGAPRGGVPSGDGSDGSPSRSGS